MESDRRRVILRPGAGDVEQDIESVKLGIAEAAKLAHEHGTDVLIYTETKRQWERVALRTALGEDAAGALKDGGKVPVSLDGAPTGVQLKGGTLRTRRHLERTEDVILSIYPDEKMMERVESSQAPALVVVPWTHALIEEWMQQHDLEGYQE